MSTTVLITGASSGIGLASAVASAEAGLTTVATVRDARRADRLREAGEKAGVEIDVVRLDLVDRTSIEACVATVLDRHGRIDALVNNAGVAGSNPTLEQCDLDDLRLNMEVNFFGVVALSKAVMPHLRASRGRLVTISSVRGVIGQPFNEGYSAAKFAIEGFMEGLAPVAAQVGVTVSLIEPAAVLDTEFVNNSSGPDVATMLAEAGPYEPAFRAYREWVGTGAIESAQLSRDVAEVVVRTLTGPPPAFRIQTSEYARRYVARKLVDPASADLLAMTRSWVSGATAAAE
ncbi:MAG TPA: SDR family NAD(P)-dependent oxidoreductase [Micromonosporaceae bacterium]